MENHPKQPQRVLPVEELQSGFAMKRRKDNPRNPNFQVPRLHLLYGLPPHTKYSTYTASSGWKNNKLKRRKCKQKAEEAKEEKG